MKKTFYSLIATLLLLGTAFSQSAQGQSLQMDIRNQQYSNDTLFFDVYLSRNGGSTDYLLGNGDFVLNFNNSNFSSPSIGYVANSADLTNSNATSTTSYEGNIAVEIGTSNPNTNKIMINVLQPTFSNGTDFATNIAKIDASTDQHRLGTFYITGLQDVTQSPGFSWVTSGSGTKTIMYALNPSSPWKSSKINSLIANDPAVGAEPTSAPTAFSVTAKTDSTLTLGWTRGNGSQIIIFAKQAATFGTDYPTDGILYDTSINFGDGSQIGSTGVYAVYNSTGTSATIYNLDPSTVYSFAAIELNGSKGYSENYYTSGVVTTTDTTTAGEPATSATDLLITAFGTNTLDLSWTNGDGAGRIVVARAGSAVSADPTDGDNYTADADFTAGQDYGSGNIVVYNGTGSSVQVTGLDTGTDYHFAVYEYNGANGTKNYKIDTPAINSRYTLSPEPVTAASNAVLDNITTTSIRLSFTGGDGYERLVLVKEGSAVDSLPLDGSTYTANKEFGSGDSLQTGNFVVYAGNLDSLTITGLTAGTTYYYEVFEFKGSATTTNYLTSSTLTGSMSTLDAEPATSATNLLVTGFSTSTLDLSWTNGDGAKRIVVARAGSAVDFAPTDTNSYDTSQIFSTSTGYGTSTDNFVVYDGTGSSVTVYGLDTNTQYHFAVYEYNGASGTQNYKIDTPAINDRYTLATEPVTAASSATVDNVATTSFRLSFTPGSGLERLVLVKEGSAVDSLPADGQSYTANKEFGSGDSLQTGNFVVYAANLDSLTITGLTAGTTYYYEVFEFRGSGESANYLTSSTLTGNATTLSGEPTIAASNLTFTAFSTSTLDLEWTKGDGTNRIVVARADSAVDFDPTDATTYTANASFGAGTGLGTYSNQYVVYNGTDSFFQVTGLDTNRQYHFAVFEYNGSTGTENYLITGPATGNRYSLAIEPTVAASNGDVHSETTTSLTISFDAGDGNSRMVVVKPTSLITADPTDGSAYTAASAYGSGDSLTNAEFIVYAGSDTSVTVTGLTANTTYFYEVYESNGSGESFNYLTSSTLTGSGSTLQDAPTVAASNLVITNVTLDSMSLSWTNGDGANRIVVARKSSAVSGDPDNATTYTANTGFGSGDTTAANQFVVYRGSGNSVIVTGLSQDTTYHFAVYEYNGSAGSENYLITTPATGSENTAIELDVFVMLEGPFNGTDMNTDLNTMDSLPSAQPYNTSPWSYAGTQTNSNIPTDLVDWVYVEVRKSGTAAGATSGTVVAQQVGLLTKDGQIMDSSGVNRLRVKPSSAGGGELYVVVYHRNHIGVMSSTPLSYDTDSNAFVFDFTSGSTQAYGSDAQALVSGKYVMYSGNADPSNTAINASDRSAAWTDRNKYGYNITDVDLDGIVGASDRSIIYNNTGQDEQIP